MLKRTFGYFYGGAMLLWKFWAYTLAVVVTILLAVGGWEAYRLAQVWPDFDALASGPIPKSKFIADAETKHGNVRWQPVPLDAISPRIVDAIVLAEDVRFWKHYGVDLPALGDAIERNIEVGHLEVGGSTISQQTVKNMFLNRERTLRRKGTELLMTLGMERQLSKERILEIYLNIAQFGPRTYGVEAAARHYFGKPATDVDDIEAASLAASLPSPSKHNPEAATREFERRRNKILWFMAGVFQAPRDRLPPQLAAASEATAATSAFADAITEAIADATAETLDDDVDSEWLDDDFERDETDPAE